MCGTASCTDVLPNAGSRDTCRHAPMQPASLRRAVRPAAACCSLWLRGSPCRSACLPACLPAMCTSGPSVATRCLLPHSLAHTLGALLPTAGVHAHQGARALPLPAAPGRRQRLLPPGAAHEHRLAGTQAALALRRVLHQVRRGRDACCVCTALWPLSVQQACLGNVLACHNWAQPTNGPVHIGMAGACSAGLPVESACTAQSGPLVVNGVHHSPLRIHGSAGMCLTHHMTMSSNSPCSSSVTARCCLQVIAGQCDACRLLAAPQGRCL